MTEIIKSNRVRRGLLVNTMYDVNVILWNSHFTDTPCY